MSAWLAALFAALALQPFDDPHFTVRAPKGWAVAADWSRGTVTMKDGASGATIELRGSLNGNTTEAALLQSVRASLPKGFEEGRPLGQVTASSFIADVSPQKMAVAVRAEPGFSMVGRLIAPASTFDAAGGAELLRGVVRSLRIKGRKPAPVRSDPQSKVMLPEVLWRQPGGITRDELVGRWSFEIGSVPTKFVDADDGSLQRYHLNTSGFAGVVTFARDQSYAATWVTHTSNGAATGGMDATGRLVEKGQWSLQDDVLTLSATSLSGTTWFNGRAMAYRNKALSPRELRVSTGAVQFFQNTGPPAANGALILEGPCVPNTTEADCNRQVPANGFVFQRE